MCRLVFICYHKTSIHKIIDWLRPKFAYCKSRKLSTLIALYERIIRKLKGGRHLKVIQGHRQLFNREEGNYFFPKCVHKTCLSDDNQTFDENISAKDKQRKLKAIYLTELTEGRFIYLKSDISTKVVRYSSCLVTLKIKS